MAEKKKRRGCPGFRLIVIIAIIAVAGFLLTADPLFNLDFGIIRTEQTATSIAVLTEVRDIFALNTIEFIYKTVFPHDFLTDDVDWGRLLQKQMEGLFLSETDRANLEVYDLCRELDISLWQENYDFVVVTSIVKGGFDLTDTVYQNPEKYPERISRAVSIGEENTVTLLLPDPVITDFIIEDSSSTTYTYPDMDIEPEKWKLLTDFVRGRVEGIVKDEGILDMARERGEVFIERMLEDAGYRNVVFLRNQEGR